MKIYKLIVCMAALGFLKKLNILFKHDKKNLSSAMH